MERLDIGGQPMRDMTADLVRHNVAITSTPSVFEAFDGSRPPIEQLFLDSISPRAAVSSQRAWTRPRRRYDRFRRSAQPRVAGGRWVHAGASHSDRDAKRRQTAGRTRLARHNSRGKDSRSSSNRRQPAARIADIRKAKIVFKDGAGYDPAVSLDSVRGAAGMHW
jgi:hypothetical protein